MEQERQERLREMPETLVTEPEAPEEELMAPKAFSMDPELARLLREFSEGMGQEAGRWYLAGRWLLQSLAYSQPVKAIEVAQETSEEATETLQETSEEATETLQ